MTYKQSSKIFIMVFLAIVATNCLAKYSKKQEMANDFNRKRELENKLWKKRHFGQRRVRSFLVRSSAYVNKKIRLKTS